MTYSMSDKVQRGLAWSGFAVVVLTCAGFFLARLLPVPPGADLSPDQVADFYGAHPATTRLGLLLATVGLGFQAPLVALIGVHMQRIEGAPGALALLQVIAGTCVVIVTVVPMLIMNVAAFRPDRSPAAGQALNDLAWLLLVTPIGLFVLQEVPIALAIFLDRSDRPVFPRWVAYANLWIPVTFLPAFFAYFFTTGPLAWQGLLVFCLGLATFGAWVVIMMWALLRAIRLQAEHQPQAASILVSKPG